MAKIKDQLSKMVYFFFIVILILASVGLFGELENQYISNYFTEDEPEHVQSYKVLPGGKIAPLTILSEEQMRIQEEVGCGATECHDK